MKDPEFGEMTYREVTPRRHKKIKRSSSASKFLTGASLTLCLVGVMLGIGLLVSRCGHLFQGKEIIVVEKVPVPDGAVNHQLDRRSENCEEDVMSAASAAKAASAEAASSTSASFSVTPFFTDGSIAIVTQSGESSEMESLVSIPISTIYSVSSPSPTTTVVKTTTETTLVTLGEETPVCSAWNATQTVTVTVIPTPPYPTPWDSGSVLGDATVIGNASTVTQVNTDVSYTSGLPDATVSGNPSTMTNVETQVSFTSGLPDATVSGNPFTLTDVQTQISFTSGLPDATISGNPATATDVQTDVSMISALSNATVSANPSTPPTAETVTSVVTVIISDLWSTPVSTPESTSLVTVTATSTIRTTVASSVDTILVTVTQYPTSDASSIAAAASASSAAAAAQTTITEFFTTTDGEPATSTTTVFIPSVSASASYPTGGTNSSVSGIPSGTATSINIPFTPVIVSGGSKKPELHAWGGSSSGNLGCVIMLIAVIMFML